MIRVHILLSSPSQILHSYCISTYIRRYLSSSIIYFLSSWGSYLPSLFSGRTSNVKTWPSIFFSIFCAFFWYWLHRWPFLRCLASSSSLWWMAWCAAVLGSVQSTFILRKMTINWASCWLNLMSWSLDYLLLSVHYS